MKASETRYRRLFETAKDGVLILDGYNGQIVDVNPYLTELLGYSHKELLGKELWEIGVFKNIVASKNAFIKLQNKEYIHFEDMPLVTKEGKAIEVEFVSNVYLVDHTKVIQCNIRNITERKLAEEKLAKYHQQLKELNATKDKLFSIIAHDLRSPFCTILGFSELLFESIRRVEIEKSIEYIEQIRSTAKQTLIQLENLLAWTKTQTGQVYFKPETLHLQYIIQEIVDPLNSSAILKNIILDYSLSDNIVVFANQNMLKTVLRNLVSNGIKFTNYGGKVFIQAVSDQSHVEITVSDNGVGMDEETCNKLFRIDTIVLTTGTANERGSGFGLILCKEFVEMNGGKIWVKAALRMQQLQQTLTNIQQQHGIRLELIDMGTEEGGTFPIHNSMYEAIASSDIIICDLTGQRPNVHVEAGYPLKHHESNRLIFLFEPVNADDRIPFNLNTFKYIPITQAAKIPNRLRPELESILRSAGALFVEE